MNGKTKIASVEDRKNNKVAVYICTFSIIIFVSNEVLSLFHMITAENIRLLWFIIFLGLMAVCCIRNKRNLFKIISISICDVFKKNWDIIIVLAIWFIYLGYLSYKTVPFNWDSMTYHLARVANWTQNQSVEYYPTNIPRQLYSPVFAEYIILQLCLLFGNDNAVNLVQYVSYILCVYFLWDILKKLNFSKYTAVLAAVLFATMPMAIAQSITTQVDLVGCMWLLLFIDIVIDLIAVEKLRICLAQISRIGICAVSIAFGYLTKSNICFLMIPFLSWLLIRCIRRKDSIQMMVLYSILAVALIVVLTAPIFIRNHLFTGDILASSYISEIMIGTFNPRYLLVNVYKNFALLAASNNSREFLTDIGVRFANLLGVDINALEISLTGDFYHELPVSYHHDIANNPIVAWIFLISLIIILVLIVLNNKITNKNFIAVCVSTVIVGLASLRYQLWGSRLLLPTCAIMCMVSVSCLENIFSILLNKKTWYRMHIYILICTVAFAIPAVQYNEQYARMYAENKDRFQMYFANREVYEPYAGICDYVEALGVANIGILLETDTYEYPLWVKLKKQNTKIIQVVEKGVTEIPECIIAIYQDMPVGCEYTYADQVFKCVYNYEGDSAYAVLVKSP